MKPGMKPRNRVGLVAGTLLLAAGSAGAGMLGPVVDSAFEVDRLVQVHAACTEIGGGCPAVNRIGWVALKCVEGILGGLDCSAVQAVVSADGWTMTFSARGRFLYAAALTLDGEEFGRVWVTGRQLLGGRGTRKEMKPGNR